MSARPPRPASIAAAAVLVAAMAAVVLGGCSRGTAPVPPEGQLGILAPPPGFSLSGLGRDWVVDGVHAPQPGAGEAGAGAGAVMVNRLGVPALAVRSGGAPLTLVRRIRAQLAATPFLSWSWSVEPFAGPYHPVRLVVGLHGGTGQRASWGERARLDLGWQQLPATDRVILLLWSARPLERGAIRISGDSALYTVRGGSGDADAGAWRLDTVDLLALYRRAWPGDDAGAARIVYVGLAAPSAPTPALAYVSGILLSR